MIGKIRASFLSFCFWVAVLYTRLYALFCPEPDGIFFISKTEARYCLLMLVGSRVPVCCFPGFYNVQRSLRDIGATVRR
ncbi:hypothetical protein F4805DRAFT_134713 [Annulohypoxylon moriforme]|nr:hypothetical protein F4805DRAFT_134713 [Annulohypoxylon moriforme]